MVHVLVVVAVGVVADVNPFDGELFLAELLGFADDELVVAGDVDFEALSLVVSPVFRVHRDVDRNVADGPRPDGLDVLGSRLVLAAVRGFETRNTRSMMASSVSTMNSSPTAMVSSGGASTIVLNESPSCETMTCAAVLVFRELFLVNVVTSVQRTVTWPPGISSS